MKLIFAFLFRVFLCALLSHSVLAAGLYVQFEGVVPDAWNPAYGYFLKNSHVLSNARLNGCYGSKRTMEELNAGNATLAVAKETWRHSTFESSRPGEYARDVENRLSYPLEPLAAFIQWLYPSPARTSLGHNANSHDPLGVWARMVNGEDATQKAQALETMAGFMMLVKFLYEQPALDDTAQKAFSRQFNGLFNPRDVGLKRIDTFKEIVFKAIQAERFDENIKKLYPVGMARYTLLAYIADVLSDREDLVAIYKKAGLMDPGYTSPAIAPLTKAMFEEKKRQIQSPPSAGVAEAPVALSDLVLYLQGRDRYDSAIPKGILGATAIVEVGGKRFSYADCGETALMNFFLIALWKDGAINPAHLDHLADTFPHIGAIREHFARFNTLELLATKESHNNWAAIVANKNSEDMANPLQSIRYNRGNVAELAGATPSLLNLFSVLFSPTASVDYSPHQAALEALMTPWQTEDLSTAEDQALVLRKWQTICGLLSRPDLDHVIALKTEKLNNKKIESTVEFTLNGGNPFSYLAGKSHFHVSATVLCGIIPQLTLSGTNTSNDIIGAAFHNMSYGSFGGQTDAFFVKLWINNFMFEEHTFRHFLKQRNTNVFIGILDAILYRALATFGYGRMDDPWIHNKVADQFEGHGFGRQSAIDLYTSSASKDFLRFQYLPSVFADLTAPAFKLCQAVMEKLKDHGEYTSYIDRLMNGANPKKWEFAAFHGVQKSNGSLYIKKLQAFQDIPFDAQHPLMHAIKGGHFKIVQHLTGQGKLPYWKAKKNSTIADRPVLGGLGKCTSLDMVKFLVENDPHLISPVADHPAPYFLKYAQTPEIFAYLQAKLGLDRQALYSFANIYGGEYNISILDVMMMEGSVEQREHIVSIFPDIPVTELTFQEMNFGFSPKVFATFIRNFQGNWDALTIGDKPILQAFLQDCTLVSLQAADMILPKLNRGTLIEGKSPYVYCIESNNFSVQKIWMLARHRFPWPENTPLVQSHNTNKSMNGIRWLFNQQNPGDVPPTLEDISSVEGVILPHDGDPMRDSIKADFEARKKAFLRAQELENLHWFRMACDKALGLDV